MVHDNSVQSHNPSSFDQLLDRHELAGSKYLLRKAFGLMLNQADTSGETGHANMVVETARIILDEMRLGEEPVLCCILKNVTDKDAVSKEVIVQEFGLTVWTLINGIRKLERIDTTKYNTNRENFIGLITTLSDDIRVLMIRLAMRLYDMRHIAGYDPEKQCKIAGETKALFIPIAHRLGLYQIKNELEDRVMHFTDPVVYHTIEQKLAETKTNRDQYTRDFIRPIARRLKESGFDCEIKSRVKSIPSIFRKMTTQKVEFEKVYDLFAIRIIINRMVENEPADCWKVYSLVTDIYTPNPRRLRDWISFPKTNGYESLHTTVIGPDGRWVEVQIRTRRMDEIAEMGYAAHWKYKGDGKAETGDLFARLREILEKPEKGLHDKLAGLEKKALYTDDIFIFTPKGDLKKLKFGYTVLDFAFEIHSEIGSTCTGAIVNGKMVPLRYTLMNGDTVKILTSKNQKPNKGWLEIVKSPRNLARVKHALKMEAYKDSDYGKEILKNKVLQLGFEFTDPIVNKLTAFFGCENILELYQRFGEGRGDLSKIKKALSETGPEPSPAVPTPEPSFAESVSEIRAGKEDFVIIDPAIKSLHYQFARCCDPVPGTNIFAFVSITQGIKIHRTSCPNAHQLITKYPYRILEARWKTGNPEG